jgi:hypothetical protein
LNSKEAFLLVYGLGKSAQESRECHKAASDHCVAVERGDK